MEDFIKRNQRPLTILLSLVFIGVFVVIFYQTFTTQTATEEVGRPVGEDGAGEVESLPYENALYTIRYQQTSDDRLDKESIVITAYNGYKTAAVEQLYEFGMNPTDYKISFESENPFNSYE